MKENIEKDLTKICFVFSLLGLFLIYMFSPENIYTYKTISEINQECDGSVKTAAHLVKVFYSSRGSLIGLLKEENKTIFVFLKNYSVIGGENILVKGKAEIYRQQCWIFPDNLEIIK